ncbi:xanthine dehydrogenase accessory protein XdhC [Rhodococcus sp. GA1]|uniref:xanthine dehydrogenase accessory protein XdhC n=1 Tax=Rhodococcus sp. GA1 TaxID=2942275 RepID=UPI0020CEEDA9|nr:xanthine dehydrogenase accessory protein XdhC [Rhodococcus sp. GA1]
MNTLERLRRDRVSGVLVTVAAVRGHAPREAGAKMVVTADATFGSVGGGNLEEVAIERARSLGSSPELVTIALSDKAPYQHGVQCCGGEVTLLLEPMATAPAVAVFGFGHVGLELARILARHDLDLYLVDSREPQFAPERLKFVDDAVARVMTRHHSLLPEQALEGLPAGTHILVMTHDHAEDLAICDAALRTAGLGSIGLIGSSAKWTNFRKKLSGAGLGNLERIRCPIGVPEITDKRPASIAVSVAAEVLTLIEHAAGGIENSHDTTNSGMVA